MKLAKILLLALSIVLLTAVACSRDQKTEVLRFSVIPDQDVARLVRMNGLVAEYLSEKLGIKVEYVPSVYYAAVVTAFEKSDIQLAWFGGLTGVQARLAAPGAEAIAQRQRDAQFHSVFIVQRGLPVEKLGDLIGLTFTFGSESSTSGHLMPRYFLVQAGIDPEKDFQGGSNYSGSHDTTWKLVESGAFQAGALSEAVWEKAIREDRVDLSKVRLFYTTAPYYDYSWVIRGDVDQTLGAGAKEGIKEALLSMQNDPLGKEILELYAAERFIETENENYNAIEEVARELGLVE